MTDEDEAVRMTVAEIAVMREIVKWRKAEGVRLWRSRKIGDFIDWRITRNGNITYVVLEEPTSRPELGYSRIGSSVADAWLTLGSFTEGVDLLVALGLLPARFSSAYAQGWTVGREEAEHPADAGAAFRAILPGALVRS